MFRKLRAEAERENGKENKLMFDNRALFALLLPIIIEQILNSFMGMVDTVMVSNVGSAANSAAARRSASPPRSCTPAGPWACAS